MTLEMELRALFMPPKKSSAYTFRYRALFPKYFVTNQLTLTPMFPSWLLAWLLEPLALRTQNDPKMT